MKAERGGATIGEIVDAGLQHKNQLHGQLHSRQSGRGVIFTMRKTTTTAMTMSTTTARMTTITQQPTSWSDAFLAEGGLISTMIMMTMMRTSTMTMTTMTMATKRTSFQRCYQHCQQRRQQRERWGQQRGQQQQQWQQQPLWNNQPHGQFHHW